MVVLGGKHRLVAHRVLDVVHQIAVRVAPVPPGYQKAVKDDLDQVAARRWVQITTSQSALAGQ